MDPGGPEEGGEARGRGPALHPHGSQGDLFASLRSGTDHRVSGRMIKHILDNDLVHAEYVRLSHPMRASSSTRISRPRDLDGLFLGYDLEKRSYDKATWAYQTGPDGVVLKDPTLQDPHCVFQLLRKHLQPVRLRDRERDHRNPGEDAQEVYEVYASTGKPDRVGTSLYAMGWTSTPWAPRISNDGDSSSSCSATWVVPGAA